MTTIVRYSYAAFGAVMLTLGVIGVVLPLMPGTVFLILAAWAFARSVPAVHRWLHDHPWLGPPLRRWAQERCIDRRIKWLATGLIALSGATGSVALAGRPALILTLLAVLAATVVYLHTRASCPARR